MSQKNQQITSNDFLPVKSINHQLSSPQALLSSEHEMDIGLVKEKNKHTVKVTSTNNNNEVIAESIHKSILAKKPLSSPKIFFSNADDNLKISLDSSQKVLDLSRSSSCDAANDQSTAENITEAKSDDDKNSRSSSLTPSFLASNSLTALAQLASNR